MTDKPENTPNPDAPVAKSPFAGPSTPPPSINYQDEKAFVSVTLKPPVSVADLVIKLLLDLPDDIRDYQQIYDAFASHHAAMLSDLTFMAFSRAMFPGKKEGEPPRVASNEEERKIAISQVINANEKFKTLSDELDEARRDLSLVKMKFEAAKIIAQLMSAK